ncbi:3-methyladenine DNA glycosylase [Propionibacteriaceae bacterium Y1700]|uniref:3-methyladenine DNA glycosylase n=1 Tax=Microlunatus sp. Y1700 TaxID=3418487 RepID=UPI003DA6FDD7
MIIDALQPGEWEAAERRHRSRVESALADHLTRSQRGIAHPVEDFLFQYYSLRPATLGRWSPGWGTELIGAGAEWSERPGWRATARGAAPDVSALAGRREGVQWIADLLAASAGRAPSYGCFGLHEWAMVHRTDRIRHPQLGLRLDPEQVAAEVEERGTRCTHFDAFRFHTVTARPYNHRQLTRDTQIDHDQPGCLHVGMDLLKWGLKLGPAAPAELIMDCFALAMEIRWVDMLASPYDLSSLTDRKPIMIETPAGRARYVTHQQEFVRAAAPLRARLLQVYGAVLSELDAPNEDLSPTR